MQLEQAGSPPPSAPKHAEPPSATGCPWVEPPLPWTASTPVRSGTEQRARTTTIGIAASLQRCNGATVQRCRHLRVCSLSASTLGVGRYAARSKPVFGGREAKPLDPEGPAAPTVIQRAAPYSRKKRGRKATMGRNSAANRMIQWRRANDVMRSHAIPRENRPTRSRLATCRECRLTKIWRPLPTRTGTE